jgi:hypothetical protein
MANADVINKSIETRRLTSKEVELIRDKKQGAFIIGTIFGIGVGGIGIGLLISGDLIPSLGFLFFGIGVSSTFFYESLNAKKDEKNGIAEIIHGTVTKKDIAGKGFSQYIEVNGRYVHVNRALWNSLSLGDSMCVELGPNSKEVFKIKKN